MAVLEHSVSVVVPKSLFSRSHPTWLFPSQVATAVENWKNAIREAQTFSRMHVLLGMLDSSIKWDMSAENARCKVCRRKGEASPGGRKDVTGGGDCDFSVCDLEESRP